MLKKLIITAFLPVLIFAASNSGTTAGAFLKINTGSRSAAMGGAVCGLSDDNEALNINPAGIAQLTVSQFSGGHIIWFSDISIEHIQSTVPLSSSLVLGLSGLYVNNGIFEAYTSGAVSAGSFTSYDAAAGLSLGVKLSEKIFLGFTAKYIIASIATDSGNGYAGDGGLLIKDFFPGISFGASLQNIGTTLKMGTTEENLPQTLRAGFAFSPAPEVVVTVDAVTHLTEGDYNLSSGIELEIVPDSVKLRAGYYYPLNSKIVDFTSGFSAGIGFYAAPVNINYAIVPGGDLGFVHRVSAAFAFGENKKKESKQEVKIPESNAALLLPSAFPKKKTVNTLVLQSFISKTLRDAQKRSIFEIIKSSLVNSKSIKVLFVETGDLPVEELNSMLVISGTLEKSDELVDATVSLSDPKTGKELVVYNFKTGSLIDTHTKANELAGRIEKYVLGFGKAK